MYGKVAGFADAIIESGSVSAVPARFYKQGRLSDAIHHGHVVMRCVALDVFNALCESFDFSKVILLCVNGFSGFLWFCFRSFWLTRQGVQFQGLISRYRTVKKSDMSDMAGKERKPVVSTTYEKFLGIFCQIGRASCTDRV